jgi:hypothetical protein
VLQAVDRGHVDRIRRFGSGFRRKRVQPADCSPHLPSATRSRRRPKRKPEPVLASALERLIAAGLLFRQGVPPEASYLFKHALVQDAAYGTLLREPRRALHARIAEVPRK